MLKVGYLNLDNPVVVISPNGGSGELRSFDGTGLLMLNGFDPEEVLTSEIKAKLEKAKGTSPLGFSVTGDNPERIAEAAQMAAEGGYLFEIDLSSSPKLSFNSLLHLIKSLKATGAVLSIRFRPTDDEVDLKSTAKMVKEAGADILHLDITGLGTLGPKLVKKASDAGSPSIMAKCDAVDFEAAKSILSMGADLISLNSNTDPEFAIWLSETFKKYGELIGWYNAPKHICSGGDLRGMAFCCPPVKRCPLMGALKKVGMTPEEFVEKKMGLAKGTALEHGQGTCFGSLVWCCKITKPCFMRDAVLDRIGLSPVDYMMLKKKLAEDLLSS